jgi:GGDEF domain-containing protein
MNENELPEPAPAAEPPLEIPDEQVFEPRHKVFPDSTFAEDTVYRTAYELGRKYVEKSLLADQVSTLKEEKTALTQENTALSQEKSQFKHAASHDSLTKLSNKALFIEKADERFVNAAPDQAFAVLYIDLDNFKQVNDSHPDKHSAGDVVLTAVAARLAQELRDDTTIDGEKRQADLIARGDREDDSDVARLGGDEFAVIAELTNRNVDGDSGSPTERFVALKNRIETALLDTLDKLKAADPHIANTQVGASVNGVIRMPGDTTDAETLLGQADNAMYLTKNHHKAVNGSSR